MSVVHKIPCTHCGMSHATSREVIRCQRGVIALALRLAPTKLGSQGYHQAVDWSSLRR